MMDLCKRRSKVTITLLLVIGFNFVPFVSAKFWTDNNAQQEGWDEEAVEGDEPVEYGVDVSFPMQYAQVSTNYPWLPHNQDPSLPVPPEYKDMVLQPLGNRDEFYKDFLQGCRDAFGKKGARCTQNELVSFFLCVCAWNHASHTLETNRRRYSVRRCKFFPTSLHACHSQPFH